MKKVRSLIASYLAIVCTAVTIGSVSVPASATAIYGDATNGNRGIKITTDILHFLKNNPYI